MQWNHNLVFLWQQKLRLKSETQSQEETVQCILIPVILGGNNHYTFFIPHSLPHFTLHLTESQFLYKFNIPLTTKANSDLWSLCIYCNVK
jgi:hypothetical protein